MTAFILMDTGSLTKEQRGSAIASLMFLREKEVMKSRGRSVLTAEKNIITP